MNIYSVSRSIIILINIFFEICVLLKVRAAAVSHLSTVARNMEVAFVVGNIIPTSQKLVSDSSEFVRAFLAADINHLAPVLGREQAVQYVLPLLLNLLRDENSEVCIASA